MAAFSGAVAVTPDRRWLELNGSAIRKATIRIDLIR
jgi:hypothetical protein